jgi:hypothetical protein
MICVVIISNGRRVMRAGLRHGANLHVTACFSKVSYLLTPSLTQLPTRSATYSLGILNLRSTLQC